MDKCVKNHTKHYFLIFQSQDRKICCQILSDISEERSLLYIKSFKDEFDLYQKSQSKHHSCLRPFFFLYFKCGFPNLQSFLKNVHVQISRTLPKGTTMELWQPILLNQLILLTFMMKADHADTLRYFCNCFRI
jgi:hypothetical protein